MAGPDLTITLQCNNNCVFCPRHILKHIATGDSMEEVMQALTRVRQESSEVTLSGGEATIMPRFLCILRHCKSLGFSRISLITNGRMLSSNQYAMKAKAAGLSSVGISIYSTEPGVHDAISRVPGSFSQAWRGLMNSLRVFAQVRVNITVSRLNQTSLRSTIADLKKLGVKEIQLISVITDDQSIMYESQQLREELCQIGERITARGFGDLLLPSNFIREEHRFDTFIPIKGESSEYLKRMQGVK
jgi:MoaA/NifB/PqqE/SkfB family radical SAM enzyme